MPEGPEVDLDRLRETIDEEIEKEGSALLRTVALTTALFAAVAAIASLEAGSTVNEALALKTEATQFQAKASDQWAYYQAKGLKATVTELSKSSWTVLGVLGEEVGVMHFALHGFDSLVVGEGIFHEEGDDEDGTAEALLAPPALQHFGAGGFAPLLAFID